MYSVELENRAKLDTFLSHADRQSGMILRDIIDDIGRAAENFMKLNAPVGKEPKDLRLKDRISRSGVKWRPGGAGGGGHYEQWIGVEDAPDEKYPGDMKYPLYVHGGTKFYMVNRPSFTNPNRPGVMTIQKLGEPVRFVRWREGQKANPFVRTTYNQMLLYARGQISKLNLTKVG